MAQFYPALTDAQLIPFRTIKSLLLKDPNYLASVDCPYAPEMRDFLAQMMGASQAAPAVALETAEDLEVQLNAIYASLTQQSKLINDQSDRIAWAKAVTGLLDRIISMRERVSNVKKFSEFQRKIIDFLDTVLEPAQREDFLERLGIFLEKQP